MAKFVAEALLGWTLVYMLVLTGGYPDFSHDYTISEADLDPLYRTFIDEQREMTEGMPRVCRRDICYEETMYDERKGEFHWPEIVSGQQVDLRCPFSFTSPVYTTRVCSVDSEGVAIWLEPIDYSICPDPPLAQLLVEMNEKIYYGPPFELPSVYREMLARVVEVFTVYRDAPVDLSDIETLVTHLKEVIPTVGEFDYPDVYDNYLTVLDTLMDNDFRNLFHIAISSYNLGESFRDDISRLPYLTPYHLQQVMTNLAIYTIHLFPPGNITLDFPDIFDLKVNDNVTVKTPTIAINIQNSQMIQEQSDSSKLSLTVLKYSYLFASRATWMLPLPLHLMDYGYQPNYYEYGEYTYFNNMSSTTEDEHEEETSYDAIPDLHPVDRFDILGSLVVLRSEKRDLDFTRNVQVIYRYHTCDINSLCDMDGPFCVKSTINHTWYTVDCEVTDSLDMNGFTSCSCSGTGAFAIFEQKGLEFGGSVPEIDSPVMDEEIIEADISAFLGFPYKKELETLGTVLGSLSLICLVATLMSYALIRRSRKGSPSTILINLCVALLILSVLLLIVQYMGDAMTRIGCTVSNVLRYYTVFASLMWNAVEAFNMYLMLLKVFDSNVRRFAMKAGIIAWGIPSLMVVICFAVNKKSFDGHYVLISEKQAQCAFQCKLNKQMIYYAYLIPLSVIILHNMIVFGFVLRIIVKHGNKLGQGKKKNHIVQLVGALATLALLGVPWVFSAFGAIDATTNESLLMLQGVFQVVFVVFVNLQGCFIFAFHCARNAQIRQSWSSALQSAVSITRTSTMGHSVNNTSGVGDFPQPEIVTEQTDMPIEKGSQSKENNIKDLNKF